MFFLIENILIFIFVHFIFFGCHVDKPADFAAGQKGAGDGTNDPNANGDSLSKTKKSDDQNNGNGPIGDDPNNTQNLIKNRTPLSITTIQNACMQARANATLESKTFTITFPKQRWIAEDSCAWGQDNNNVAEFRIKVPYDGRFTSEELFNGRRRQTQIVEGPQNWVICDQSFSFRGLSSDGSTNEFEFDDVLFLTVKATKPGDTSGNELLLASSLNYTEYMQRDGNVFLYRWEDLKSKAFNDFKVIGAEGTIIDQKDEAKDARIKQNYCFGATGSASCSLPIHGSQTSQGTLVYHPSETAIKELSRHLSLGTALEFGLIVAGDGEYTDCQLNKDITFDITVKYTVPK
ncbi:MAG: hypothetical protein KBD78_12395 [Oligoflexales bacterium]|nr:hypothetical protein [Oligoflexales bacterium]